MHRIPWDQRLARVMVRPMAELPIAPNHLTTLVLCMSLSGAALFVTGNPVLANWAAGVFVLSRFLDHFDGELARLQGVSSRFGYYYDYVAGGLGYGALFLCMGLGFQDSWLGTWAIVLGMAGCLSALVSMFINVGIDKVRGKEMDGDAHGYLAFAGIELEDGIYLLAPITWLGMLMPFFVAATVGATVYFLWSLWTLLRLRRISHN